jgi:hypothetical protein
MKKEVGPVGGHTVIGGMPLKGVVGSHPFLSLLLPGHEINSFCPTCHDALPHRLKNNGPTNHRWKSLKL